MTSFKKLASFFSFLKFAINYTNNLGAGFDFYVMCMSIVYQTDKRSGITYAYESKAYWDKEKKQSRSKRTLIGRVDPETGEIRKTDGRCKKNSPYQTIKLTEQDEMLSRLKGMKVSELKQEILRLEMENRELKKT